jgi:parvulin-like peptidyl-prolyl isomerase
LVQARLHSCRQAAWAAGLLALGLIGGCLGGNEPVASKAPRIVAAINGESISLEEYQQALTEDKEGGSSLLTDNDTAQRIKRDLLERMIDTRLLIQEARRKHLEVDPQLVKATMLVNSEQYPPEQLQQELAKKNKTMDSYRKETEELLLLDNLLKQEVLDRIAIDKDEVDKYYQAHQQEFVRPEEVRVRQIVTRTEQEAKDLRQKIQQGASFEELAKSSSLGPEAKQGGDLGYFPRGRMPPAIENASFDLWSNRVSAVVPSPYGFHLFQLIDRRSARTLSLEQGRPEIERILLEQKAKEAEAYYLRTLREKAKIERDLNLLDWAH